MCCFHFLFVFLFFSLLSCLIVQIKHEPCQVSEITTSNNTQSTRAVHLQAQTQATNLLRQEPLDRAARASIGRPIVKSEIKSPTEIPSIASTTSLSIEPSNMDHNNTNSVQSGQLIHSYNFNLVLFYNPNRHEISSIPFTIIINMFYHMFLVSSTQLNSLILCYIFSAFSTISHCSFVWFFFCSHSKGAIPVGIAVARQRFQEHAQQHQAKDINRFGNIGLTTDLGEFTFPLVLFCFLFGGSV